MLKKIAAVALLSATISAAHAHGYNQPQVYIAPQAVAVSYGGYNVGYGQPVVYQRPVYREVYRQEYRPMPYYGHHHHHHHGHGHGYGREYGHRGGW